MNTNLRSWVNPYLDLVETKPEYLLAFAGRTPSSPENERRVLADRFACFSRRIVELGSGSGGHLIERAAADPAALYLGFELRYKRAYRCAEKIENLKLPNALVLRTDARELPRLVSAESIAGVYINFPEPWSRKRRWFKHRLLNEAYLQELHQVLQPGGFLSYKTDHQECFEAHVAEINRGGLFCIKNVTTNLYASEHRSGNVSTEFEKLFVSKGLPIRYLLAEKLPAILT